MPSNCNKKNRRKQSFLLIIWMVSSKFQWAPTRVGSDFSVFQTVLRIRDIYPGSRIPDLGSRISDPGSKNSNKRERWKKICYHTFFESQISQNWILCYFWNAKEKNLGQFSKNCWSFYPKIFQYALKYMGLGSGIRDPGSGIRKKPIPNPGSQIQGSKRHRIPDPGSLLSNKWICLVRTAKKGFSKGQTFGWLNFEKSLQG